MQFLYSQEMYLIDITMLSWEGHGNPLQYSCLENLVDRGAWRATHPKVAKSWTWLKQLSTCAHTMFSWGFPDGSVVKNPPADAEVVRDMGSIPAMGRSPEEGHGSPLQCSGLENLVDRGAWRTAVQEATQSRTRLKWLSIHMHLSGNVVSC